MVVVARYRFEGNTNDSTGANNGTGTNITYVGGVSGQGASFNATSSKVVVANSASLNSSTMSVGANVYLRSYAGIGDLYIRGIIGKYITSESWTLAVGSDGTVSGQFYLNFGANSKAVFSQAFPLNKRVYVVGTTGGGNINLYMDGKLVATQSYNIPTNTDNVQIGQDAGGGNRYWDGFIDEVVLDNIVWNNAYIVNQNALYKGFM